MNDAFVRLSAYLTGPPRQKDKAPDGFDTQLKATCEATTRDNRDAQDIRVILLQSGFQTPANTFTVLSGLLQSPRPSSVTSAPAQEPLPMDRNGAERPTTQGSSGSIDQDQATLPYAKQLPSVFPPYICRAVMRLEARAEVAVSSAENSERSLLNLCISPTKVSYFAKELFGVDVDFEDGRMCLAFENGASAQITSVTLTGAKPDALDQCFGREVATAIQRSSKHSSELTHGEVVTDCVSLTIQKNSGFYCVLSLVLNSEALSKIVARLWRE